MEFSNIHTSHVTKIYIDRCREEVMKLKPKKRKNWNSYIFNNYGVKSKVIYNPENDSFYNYSKDYKCWCMLESYSDIPEEERVPSNLKSDFVQMVQKQIKKNNIKDAEEIDAMWDLATGCYIEQMSTGKHVPMSERLSWNKRRHEIPV